MASRKCFVLVLVLALSGICLISLGIHQLTTRGQKSTSISNSSVTEKILRQVENRSLICSTNSSGEGWTVIQQRFDGSVDFNRSWVEYREGFGEVAEDKEFWWGLERIHQLTKAGKYELLIEMKDAEAEFRFARYSEFVVEGEPDKYRLAKLDGYSGTAGDINLFRIPMLIPTGQQFSTYDSKNDQSSINCASKFGGGWWYYNCGTCINSRWKRYNNWWAWTDEALLYSRMLVRSKT